ncbi:NupC/NupG family nucleoside CNT transporter [Rhodopirellula sallentina]|uniref:Nucleoside transport protein (Nucleoside permease NupC) n=1 Tax=Rhodopirellula sallentina SM41 TaxID=1263870 RepID=M5UFA6_9BACT|nr:nucleoside transporter C-terminal domain-containing protein [Rhodopirellula sallentina]EMI56531.1 nucleoside transport protein (nucleoside permease NupC) [Rhodopirellula sallentina SM41]
MSDFSSRATCLLGLAVFIALAWLVSTDRRRFPIRVVVGGLLLQMVLAYLILQTTPGEWLFRKIGEGFESIMSNVDVGSGFLFTAAGHDVPFDALLIRTFAFGVLPTVIFFSSLMSVLYYLGIMQKLVGAMAWVMKFTLGTSGPETLAAAANVFVGHTEAPLVVRPYLNQMSRSELCAMMTGGFATVTGGLLGAYAGMGIEISHLLTASVISAPAALLIAKVMVPETSVPAENHTELANSVDQTSATPVDVKTDKDADSVSGRVSTNSDSLTIELERENVNLIGAAVEGASEGMKLAINVAAMLIAFLALIALVDTLLATICESIGWVSANGTPAISLGVILGYLGWPIAWLLGIPANECLVAGRLIGLKTVANEFVAYQQLGEMMKSDSPPISARTGHVLTYALAGFSNFAAIGIQVGGVGGLAPKRKAELAQLGLRAMFGGLLACCMTGAIASLMM